MPKFTVAGVYRQPLGQRFGTTVEAATPQEAERAAMMEADSELMVACVIEGEHEFVDTYTDGYSFGVPGPSDAEVAAKARATCSTCLARTYRGNEECVCENGDAEDYDEALADELAKAAA